MKKPAGAFACGCAIMIAFALAWQSDAHAQEPYIPPPTPVETAKVIKKEIREILSLHGNVHAEKSATVRAEVQGSIISFEKEIGDSVKDGEAVCRIDPARYRIKLESARAELAKAEAALKKAALVEKRLRRLYKNKVVPLEQIQEAELDRLMAEAEVQARKASVENAQRDLSMTVVRAPYSGKLAAKHLDTGDWVKSGDPVFDIVNFTSVYIYVDLPERELGRLRLKTPARIWLDAYPDVEFSGTVRNIAPRASKQTREFTLRIELDDPDKLAREGMFARVDITPSERTALMVSKDAVVQRGPVKMVFIVKDGVAKQVVVEVLQQIEDLVEVRGDLSEGDEIVVTGNEILRDGAKVNVALRR